MQISCNKQEEKITLQPQTILVSKSEEEERNVVGCKNGSKIPRREELVGHSETTLLEVHRGESPCSKKLTR